MSEEKPSAKDLIKLPVEFDEGSGLIIDAEYYSILKLGDKFDLNLSVGQVNQLGEYIADAVNNYERLKAENAELKKAVKNIVSKSYCTIRSGTYQNCFEEIEYVKNNPGAFKAEVEKKILEGKEMCAHCLAKKALEKER